MTVSGEFAPVDIAKVRRFFDDSSDVTDQQILDALDWFRRDSHRHMLAARSISRSLSAGKEPTNG